MTLSPGFQRLGELLQEASTIGHNDVRARLSDAATEVQGNYLDHTGDGETGHVIFSDKTGNMQKAPYSISGPGGKKAVINHEKAKPVTPAVSYVSKEAATDSTLTDVQLVEVAPLGDFDA